MEEDDGGGFVLPEEEEAAFGGGSDDATVEEPMSEFVLKSGRMRGAAAVLVMSELSGGPT